MSSPNDTRVLTLRSYDINPLNTATTYFSATGAPVVTAAGTVADNRFTLTWNNVNFRQLVGDAFYNKYNKFHIRLNTFMIGQTSTAILATQTIASADARSVDIYLSGLPWDPAPYNQGSSTKSGSRVQIVSLVLPVLPTTAGIGVGLSANYANGQAPSYTFSKPTDSQNITIQMVTASTQTAYIPASAPLLYGHTDFIFEIQGLPDEETMTMPNPNLMSNRR